MVSIPTETGMAQGGGYQLCDPERVTHLPEPQAAGPQSGDAICLLPRRVSTLPAVLGLVLLTCILVLSPNASVRTNYSCDYYH